jgi:hypothetical protein
MSSTRQRKQNLLTARNIETAKKPRRYSDGNGLYLVVRSGGSRQWVFLYRRDGKLKEMGLGSPAKGTTLAMARGLRDEARAVMVRGEDPLEARRQSEQATSDVPRFGAYALALSIGSKRGSQIRSIASNGATPWKPVASRSGRRRSTQSTRRVSCPV